MREGAQAKADELGVTLDNYAGRIDGDHETQVSAIETCIANEADGILLVASDTSSIVSSVEQAREGRPGGVRWIPRSIPLTRRHDLATDNFVAGELIGRWAAGTLGDRPPMPASLCST